ncbi:general odorant-binding protein 57b-like [Drosophila nasuta]|uniref:general odorant-binding protein 57b-like n=1 Tax=Drosophila nasuta TaxID=42062 RepID=UPI00295E2E24|nr:general odorant-binding protein 57b-like [Drosophila nasuta]
MSKQQTSLYSVLLLCGLLALVECRHPFDFFEESFEDFEHCLQSNNITHDEYEAFEAFGNKENLLKDKVEAKFKCNIDCQLQKQPIKWLNQQGRMDLKLMNATTEAAESITNCMRDALNEQCSYSFKLVICAYLANHPVVDYEYNEESLFELPADDYEYQTEESHETVNNANTILNVLQINIPN